MAAKKKEASTEVAVKEASTAVAVSEEERAAIALYEGSEETGFEGTSKDDFAIPFIKLLQKMSPEVDPDNGAYIEGAKAGMFLNTADQSLHEEVLVIPCLYKRAMVEWKPNQGGFVAQHEPEPWMFELPRRKRDDGSESGVYVLENGNDLVDTRYWFVLHVTDDYLMPAIVSLTSTQIKKSKTWLTQLNNLKTPGGKTYPMWAHVWRFSSVPEENEHGSWRGYKIVKERLITDRSTFDAAVAAREMFAGKATDVRPPEEASTEGGGRASKDGDEIPF